MSNVSGVLGAILGKDVRLWVHCCELHFDDAGGVLSTDEIEILTRRSGEVIALLMNGGDAHIAQPAAVARLPSDLIPLTFQQESALFYREPGFCGIFSVRLRGHLNVDILSECLARLVERHEVLRTRLVVVDGALRQQICEPPESGLTTEDLTDLSESSVEEEAKGRIEIYVGRWFCEGASTFEARLLRLGKNKSILVVPWDHMFGDQASAILLFSELWSSYRDLCDGREPALPQKTLIRYAEYAVWQRQSYGRWFQKHSGYWKERLAGTQDLCLPADGQTVNNKPFSFSTQNISFGKTLTAGIDELARRERTSPALVVLTLYVTLVSLWSRQKDFLIPYYVSGRHLSRHLNVIGFFAHPLPLRIELTGDETLAQVLRLSSQEFANASSHLDIGKSIQGIPHPFKTPFFQWFSSTPTPTDIISDTREWNTTDMGLTVEPFPVLWRPPDDDERRIESPILLQLWNTNTGIVGHVFYRVDLFAPPTMEWFTSNLRRLADCIIREPHRRILDLPLDVRPAYA